MADGAFKQVHQGVYGQGISPEDGLDQPRYDTSQLAERMQRFEAVPPWMKAIEPYDASQAFDTGANAVREQMWDKVLAKGMK
jgi:hypothetical protein